MPGHSVRHRLAVVAASALLLPLTACTDDAPEPDALESPTPTPTATPSPTNTPDAAPTLPPEAHGTSKKSAEAFVRYAIDVLNYSGQTLDLDPLRAIQSSNCSPCESVVRTLTKIKRSGGSVSGGEWRPIELVVLDSAEPGQQIQVFLKYGKQVVHVRRGSKPQVFEAGQAVYRFTIRREGDRTALGDFVEVS